MEAGELFEKLKPSKQCTEKFYLNREFKRRIRTGDETTFLVETDR